MNNYCCGEDDILSWSWADQSEGVCDQTHREVGGCWLFWGAVLNWAESPECGELIQANKNPEHSSQSGVRPEQESLGDEAAERWLNERLQV